MPSPPEGTRFKPGQSGNPAGRPRGLERQVREMIADESLVDPERGELDGWKRIGLRLFAMVVGDGVKDRDRVAAAKLLYERGWGHPRHSVDVTTGSPIDATDIASMTDEELVALAGTNKP